MTQTLSRSQLAQQMAAIATLEGEFTLRSGQVSHRYFDKYRFEGSPKLLKPLAQVMAELLPSDTEIIAGLEMGEAKTYGTCRALEGQDVAGKKVTFIEDVITTGGAVADAYDLTTGEGAQVLAVVCAIWRGEGDPKIAKAPDLKVVPAFTRADLEREL